MIDAYRPDAWRRTAYSIGILRSQKGSVSTPKLPLSFGANFLQSYVDYPQFNQIESSHQNINSNRIALEEHAMEVESTNLPASVRASFAKHSVGISEALSFIDRIPSRLRRHITFYRLHLLYFIILGLIGSFIFWFAPPNISIPVSFLDALFNIVSAMTVTGLTIIRTGQYHTFDAVLFMIIIVLGSQESFGANFL